MITQSEEVIIEFIKDIILKKNDWIEIDDIADVFGVNRNKQLFVSGHNSTIAQLINRYLKKQGIKTQKIEFEDASYSIWVCAPNV